jgi:hypothetical protein
MLLVWRHPNRKSAVSAGPAVTPLGQRAVVLAVACVRRRIMIGSGDMAVPADRDLAIFGILLKCAVSSRLTT